MKRGECCHVRIRRNGKSSPKIRIPALACIPIFVGRVSGEFQNNFFVFAFRGVPYLDGLESMSLDLTILHFFSACFFCF